MPRRNSRRQVRQNGKKCGCMEGWLVVLAGLMIGLGVGLLTGRLLAFLLIGLGLGALFAYFMHWKK